MLKDMAGDASPCGWSWITHCLQWVKHVLQCFVKSRLLGIMYLFTLRLSEHTASKKAITVSRGSYSMCEQKQNENDTAKQ